MADQGAFIEISIDQLEFDLANPRHDTFKRPSQVIDFLVTKERVVDLAEDIAREGMNPMDLLGVVQRRGGGKQPTYIAAEGNRRVCALILLHDPERIPTSVVGRPKYIARLEAAARLAHLPPSIHVVLFKSKASAKPWIERMHIQGGQSRRRWSPDQQERAMGGGRNRDAAGLLDVALRFGMISPEERASKLTTVQRYLGNRTMRKQLGLHRDATGGYWIDRNIEDFRILLEGFLNDIRNGVLSSRSNAADVIRYSDKLVEDAGITDQRVSPLSLNDALERVAELQDGGNEEDVSGDDNLDDGEDGNQDTDEGDQERIKPRLRLGENSALETAFARSNSQKLQSLYLSCTQLPLRSHCPLITVGLWSMMESLAALSGGEGTSFEAYFSHQNLENRFGFASREQRKHIVVALKRLTSNGNSTKHSAVAASFDGNQIANDFDVLAPLMLAVLANLAP